MAVTAETIHRLAHAARMQQVLADNPEHPRATLYAEKLTEYRAQWAELNTDERDAIQESVAENPSLANIAPDDLIAARSALEA